MNFSDKVKKEIVDSGITPTTSLLAGFARGNLSLTVSGKRMGCVMNSDLSEVASFIFSGLIFQGAELDSENLKGLNSAKVFNITLQGEKAREFLTKSQIILFSGDKLLELIDVVPEFAKLEENSKDYLIGVFLSAGSVFVPSGEQSKIYQLEFTFASHGFAKSFVEFLFSIGFNSKCTVRGESAVVYIKESEEISDMLAYMGAVEAMLEVQNVKVYRSVRNNQNRISNCEVGNIGKTVEAAQKQINAILKLQQSGKFELLDNKLKEVGLARLNSPEEKLETLALSLGISKSCINHRLRKIVSISEDKE